MLPNPAYVGYRAGSLLARLIPGPAVEPVTAGLGLLGSQIMGGRAEMVARHQRRVRPDLSPAELDRAVRAVFASYAHYWVESFRLPGTSAADLDREFRTEGFEHIESAMAAGSGVILGLPHLGGWEWAAFWLTRVRGYPVTAVAEPVDPPELAQWFVGLRETFGMEVVPLGPAAGAASTRALRANRILALLSDRDVAGGGIEVDFLGERTTLPGGPATLALRTGAPLVPATVIHEDGGHLGIVRPPLDTTRHGRFREDVARITQDLATELEALIRRAPEQWHLLQPNWPSDRAPKAT